MAMIPVVATVAAGSSSAASPKDHNDVTIHQDDQQGWVLRENPLYSASNEIGIYLNSTAEGSGTTSINSRQLHHYHPPLSRCLPLSARANASSFRGLTRPLSFTKAAVQHPGNDVARSQILQLKSELELERRMHEKTQCLNKKLVKEVEQERRGKEEAERARSRLQEEISLHKGKVKRMRFEPN